MHVVVDFKDHILRDYAARLDHIAGSGMGMLAQALNEGGAEVREQTVAAETAQTGLPYNTLDRAQREFPATSGSLTYTIFAKGGNVRLKFFGPSEVPGGVIAHPWNRPTFYANAFVTSGRPGARFQVAKLNGQVFMRNTPKLAWNRNTKKKITSPIVSERSGLFIPIELTTGQTASTFESGSASVLATTVIKRLGSLLP